MTSVTTPGSAADAYAEQAFTNNSLGTWVYPDAQAYVRAVIALAWLAGGIAALERGGAWK